MTAAAHGTAERAFALFLGLQRQARQATSTEQLAYAMVNDGQAMFAFRHAALLIAGKVQALTGISVVEANAPFVAFVERAVGKLQVGNSEQLHLIPLIADVRVRPPKGMYGESNSVRYLPRGGQAANAPTFSTGPANPSARPPVATATPAANGLPWKRQA